MATHGNPRATLVAGAGFATAAARDPELGRVLHAPEPDAFSGDAKPRLDGPG
jgi:hypothetical protein